jgi:histidinol-phosphate aminotransferase
VTLARLHLSESAYGVSPAALLAATSALKHIAVYPDPARQELTELLAAHHGVAPDQVAVANGSDELVLLSALSVGRRDRPGITTAATFPGYRICLETVGRGCREVPLRAGSMDVPALIQGSRSSGVTYVCNPHNPTGGALRRDDLAALTESAASSGVPLILDEAYLEFAPEGTPQLRDHLTRDRPLISLRTFSKAYGLASLRIGYALGSAALIADLRRAQGALPFSVNRVAQSAAAGALADPAFLKTVRDRNAEQRAWFREEVARRGGTSLPSVTNFVAVAAHAPAAVAQKLATEHGILVRDTEAFGLDGYLRVSLGQRDDLVRLLDALERYEALTGAGTLT